MTIAEIEARNTALDGLITEAQNAAKALVVGSSDFDAAYKAYLDLKAEKAAIPAKVAAAKKSENAEKIKKAATDIAGAITQLIAAMKIDDLIGEKLVKLSYNLTTDEKTAQTVATVLFNPVTRLASTGKRESGKRTMIGNPDGTHQSLTAFVKAHAPEADWGKYPHTLVDTQPKFEAFCTKYGLSGFTYQKGSK